MKTYLSLLRGINVGGHRKIRMAELKSLYESLGFENVRSYLQSGNVVFAGSGALRPLAARIEKAILTEFGVNVSVLLFDANSYRKLVESSPLVENAMVDAAFLHMTFLFDSSRALAVDEIPLGSGEQAIFQNDHYYLYCPNGYGRTKITNSFFERKLKVSATTRNWKTVLALRDMLEE